MNNISRQTDYLFETSWEVCNMVGGIYTVISTKAPLISKALGNNYILIGPDVWKETGEHPDFTEEPGLFQPWKSVAEKEGLNFRVGRWNIPGHPLVILVDFTPYFSRKNEIFTYLWEKYKVDSLAGAWDYIEPALFGYAAARVIHSFYNFYLSANDKIVAQFHEWMTGAGVLYLKDQVPQAGTIFTTHATIMGRSVAGNGMPLYRDMEKFNTEALARSFNINSKYSLEKTSAAEADCFTTVSEITSRECEVFLGKTPDVITVNGFDDSFVPPEDSFKERRSKARERLFEVAEAMLATKLSRKSLLVINSGRYEFRNKGIDLFIDALGQLNREEEDGEVVAFITIPAHHTGPDRHLAELMKHSGGDHEPFFTTHNLHDPGRDPILDRIRKNDLKNTENDRVKILFVPAYLNGDDGILNMTYYDLLIGFDLSVFPSYYEPWGYTPLESTAFHIPTVTTSLAGFGRWIMDKKEENPGIRVIERTDDNDDHVTQEITSFLSDYRKSTGREKERAREDAFQMSRTALWENLLNNYVEAFSKAAGEAKGRSDLFFDKKQSDAYFLKDISKDRQPVWNKVFVEPAISGKLENLQKLARNLWWTWNPMAEELFRMINPERWEEMDHNPMALLESLLYEEIEKLRDDKIFLAKLEQVWGEFDAYMKEEKSSDQPTVAYFSMEYGLHSTLKIYSGGLGVLAGDFLKEASDSNKDIIAVGLLYRYGYFKQDITLFGDQVATYEPQKFTHLPVLPVRDDRGEWLEVTLSLPGRNLYAKVWRVDVGRVPLYLLDTDITENQAADRTVTHQLYGGDWENRLKQELLLGVGGVRILEAMKVLADVYHYNEGHASFAGLERLRLLVQQENLSFDQALEVVRSSSLFTTHTPVPAGHDLFSEDLMRTYIPHYASRLNISWERFINLGRVVPDDPSEKFSMSVLAMRLSQQVNGVSKIHGRVSREMFGKMFPGFFKEELHIGHVTNGVHYPTWSAPGWQELFKSTFGDDFFSRQDDPGVWDKIYEVPDKTIWSLKNRYRQEMMEYLSGRLSEELTKRQENPRLIYETIESLQEERLTVGFARRFATYKRAHLLFSHMEKLKALVNDKERPLRFIFAGKAHPADKAGQDLIKKIIEISRRPEFTGKIIFVENYDMALALKLLSGVDVWLNTPTRPLEASGTSGEKALMNGVLNLSVLDGWWAEGYTPDAGWAIPETRTYANQQFQDELDAITIFDLLEDDILPSFYERKDGVPEKWTGYMKNSIAKIAPRFTMRRMLNDYYQQYYYEIAERSRMMRADAYRKAIGLDSWKSKVKQAWDGIEVLRVAVPDSSSRPLRLGEDFIAEVEVSLNGLAPEDMAMDIVFGQKENDEVKKIVHQDVMERVEVNGQRALYRCRIPTGRVGVFDYAFRLFPHHPDLPHRMDMNMLRWI